MKIYVVVIRLPWQYASNEYPQSMFVCGNKKYIITFWLKKKSILSESIIIV